MEISISLDKIQSALLFASKKDIRYYLESLHLETGPCGARLTGCDGHTLGQAFIAGEYPSANIIIPRSLFDWIKAIKHCSHVTLEFNEGDLRYENGNTQLRDIKLTYVDLTKIGKEVDGRYPDTKRVVPLKTSGDPAHYNPDYLVRIAKAQKLLGLKNGCAEIGYNGKGGALINITDEFLAVVMPVRSGDFVQSSPHWSYANLQANDSAPLKEAA